MNKDFIYQQLYWLLTREPSVKLAIFASMGVALLFGCAVFYSVLAAAF